MIVSFNCHGWNGLTAVLVFWMLVLQLMMLFVLGAVGGMMTMKPLRDGARLAEVELEPVLWRLEPSPDVGLAPASWSATVWTTSHCLILMPLAFAAMMDWNQDSKQTFPPLHCFCHVFCPNNEQHIIMSNLKRLLSWENEDVSRGWGIQNSKP